MRKLAIAVALASTALATPAVARDNSIYVGLEGGFMVVEDSPVKVTDGLTNPEFKLDHGNGYDVDAIAGYDFGPVRVEAELGYKHAVTDSIQNIFELFDADGNVSSLSLMGNVLLDFGDDDGWNGYIGGGVGMAKVKYSVEADDVTALGDVDVSDSDSRFAYQAIAGVRRAITPNLDLGLKYRFFTASKLKFNDGPTEIESRFRSHSARRRACRLAPARAC